MKVHNRQIPETENRLLIAWGWGVRVLGMTINGYGVSFGDNENALELVLIVSQSYIMNTTEYTL